MLSKTFYLKPVVNDGYIMGVLGWLARPNLEHMVYQTYIWQATPEHRECKCKLALALAVVSIHDVKSQGE